MSSFRLLTCCLVALWCCTSALAQQSPPSSDALLQARATDLAPVSRVDPSTVRIASVSAVDFDEVVWSERRGGGDSLAYFDTTGAEFAIQINSDAADGPGFSVFETSQRFTPGFGISPPCGTDCPRGGVAASAGKITEFGFRVAGGGVGGTGSLLLIFSKFESDEETFGFSRPSTDVVLAIDLAGIAPNGFNVVDVSPFNLFFEEDEEWIWGMQVADVGDGPAFIRPVLDDGLANIGPLAEVGYYAPRRSGGVAYFSSGPSGPGLYLYTRPDDNNHWWFNRLNGQQPVVDTEVNAVCGTNSDACQFQGGDTLDYTACGQNNTSSNQRVKFRIFANGPGLISDRTIFQQTVLLPPNVGACQNFSGFLFPVLPSGRYEIRVDVRDNADNLLDYDHFFFLIGDGEAQAALDPMEANWLAQPEGAWTFTEQDSAPSSAARGTTAVLGAYPNPFARETTIRFATTDATDARLVIYDVTGREVAVLLDGTVDAGTHDVVFNARGLASGLYVYRLEAGAQVQQGRITLLH